MDDLLPTLADTVSNSTGLAAPIVGELLDEVDLEQCRLLGPFALVIQVRISLCCDAGRRERRGASGGRILRNETIGGKAERGYEEYHSVRSGFRRTEEMAKGEATGTDSVEENGRAQIASTVPPFPSRCSLFPPLLLPPVLSHLYFHRPSWAPS
jgi:hypothetical protein